MNPTVDILNQHCNVCDKTYNLKAIYIRHLVVVHKINLLQVYPEPNDFDPKNLYCKTCDIKYKTKTNFKHHLKSIHDTVLFPHRSGMIPDTYDPDNYCISCDKTLGCRERYINHLALFHIDQKPELYQGIDCRKPRYKELKGNMYCSPCKKVFLSRRLRYIHLIKKHDIKIIPSKVSDKVPDVDFTNKHCNVCDKTYKSPAYYRNHLERIHGVKARRPGVTSFYVNRSEVPIVDEKNNYCTACDKVSKIRSSYKSHLLHIHGIALPKRSRYMPVE